MPNKKDEQTTKEQAEKSNYFFPNTSEDASFGVMASSDDEAYQLNREHLEKVKQERETQQESTKEETN